MNEEYTYKRREWQNGRFVTVEYTLSDIRAMNDDDLADFIHLVYEDGYYDGAGN